jgi:FkbM family methyltransferase
MQLNLFQKLHMVHRCWRLRFKSQVPSIRYVRQAELANATLLDIGANRGVYSIYLSRAAGPDGRVVAFEAQPELGEHLRAVKDSFKLRNLSIVNSGLSSRSGEMLMRRSESGCGMASFHKWADEGLEELQVPVMTLDDYDDAHGLAPVRFIKCSVEGHEFDVFVGARRLLARDQPTLLFKCRDFDARRGEIFRLLTDLGYDGYFFYVSGADHKSLRRKGRSQLVPYDQQAAYPRPHPVVQHRDYVFVPTGRQP